MKTRRPLSTKDMMVVHGPVFGGPLPPGSRLERMRSEVQQANEADAIRRSKSPTREELAESLLTGAESENDRSRIAKFLLGHPIPAGRPSDSHNATLARDIWIYLEYGRLLGKGFEKKAARVRVGNLYDVGDATVKKVLSRVRGLIRGE